MDSPANKRLIEAIVDSENVRGNGFVARGVCARYEVMKDKKYAMLLKTKLGASTVEEVRAEVKKQLVNDPTFMNSVRAQVKTAADEASKGVSQGWSDQKVLDRLQANLLPISGLVANKIDELGSSAGNIADNKVDDTVHKFLPGKLGDWVSDKVGNKVKES